MTSDSIKLIERYESSLGEYFGKVTDDRLVAMSINPLLATLGFEDITALLLEDGKVLVKRARDLLAKSIVEIANGMLQKQGSGGK